MINTHLSPSNLTYVHRVMNGNVSGEWFKQLEDLRVLRHSVTVGIVSVGEIQESQALAVVLSIS